MSYQISNGGGRFAGGIPSLDAAISIAIDAIRYDDELLDVGEDPEGQVVTIGQCRNADITVETREYEEYMGPAGATFTMVLRGWREEFGIHLEHRCPTCQRPGWRTS